MTVIADAVAHISARPAPVVIVDTCNFLDLFRRDTTRRQPRVPAEEIRIAFQLLQCSSPVRGSDHEFGRALNVRRLGTLSPRAGPIVFVSSRPQKLDRSNPSSPPYEATPLSTGRGDHLSTVSIDPGPEPRHEFGCPPLKRRAGAARVRHETGRIPRNPAQVHPTRTISHPRGEVGPVGSGPLRALWPLTPWFHSAW